MRWVPRQRSRLLLILLGVVVASAGLVRLLQPTDEAALAQTMRTGSRADRLAAVEELESRQTVSATRLLAQAAGSEDPGLAAAALLSLGRVGPDPPQREQAVVNALNRREPTVRKAAAVSYGRIFPVGQARHSEKVIALLKSDQSTDVRLAAAKSLGYLHVYDALPALLEAMDDKKSQQLQGHAAAAAMRILCERMDFKPGAPVAERRKVIEMLAKWANHPTVKEMHAGWLKHRHKRGARPR